VRDGFAVRPRRQAAAPHKSLRASPSAPKWSGLAVAQTGGAPFCCLDLTQFAYTESGWFSAALASSM
jgi:hypothetical protein